mmetsp:Transcript_41427/g.100070  ORF Transcript_41427/g.100070 Transcript_41427/m.100070 type:complete len:770 (-) Transcript_41427:68-2377(-)
MSEKSTPAPRLLSRQEQIAYDKMIADIHVKFPVFDAEEIKQYHMEFQMFDIDGSGDIDEFEVMQLFRKIGEKIPRKAAKAVIEQFSLDGDGSIDFEEFLAMMYGLKIGSLNASDGFLRAYLLERSSHEAIVDMCRMSSSNLTELKITDNVKRGRDWRIHDSLRINTTLDTLCLNRCALQMDDAKLVGNALLDNHTLKTLDLNSNSIEDEGFEKIAAALRMPPDSQDALAYLNDAIAEMKDLKIDYAGVEKEYNQFLRQLKQENGIVEIKGGLEGFMFNEPGTRIKFDQVRKKMDDLLQELEVAGLRIADAREYYENLKGNRHLTNLDCGANYLFEPSGFEMANTLLWNTTLVSLNLGANSIGEEGIMAIATSLAHHVSLTSLNLEGNIFGAVAGTSLARMLMTNTRLTRCDFADNSIADDGCREFSKMMETNRTLLSLDLSGNLLTAPPARQLVKVICDHRKQMVLTSLSLLRNVINPSEQLLIQHDLGKDWKYKGEVQGIACKLRALPPMDEAVAALTDAQIEALESAFHAFDDDGSGDIDASELFNAVEMLQLSMEKEEVEDMVRAIDKDGSGSIDFEEFKGAMAVMFALNSAEDDDSEDEVEDVKTEDEQVQELMFASGVYDPCHVFPDAMKWNGAKQLASYPALRMGYRLLCQVERNASLSDKHQDVVKRTFSFLGWDKKTLKKRMPYTARQLKTELSNFEAIAEAPEPPPQGSDNASEKTADQLLEERLGMVEIPSDDQAKLDQSILWIFRGIPMNLVEEDDDA